jgi:two-component system cell cycle response regulator
MSALSAAVPCQPRSKGNVLVVDDSRVVRAMVGGYLRRANYTVSEADNGRTALNILETQSFDVVITDLKMPEVDGFGVLESVKRQSQLTEVIILTGTHAKDMDCALRALRLGAHDYLPKPPQNADQVLLTVERALEKKNLQEANLRLLREMEAQSRTDALTGVLNRRAFEEGLDRELARAVRYNVPLSVVFLDLDHFKGVNDTYGHSGGDDVLKAVAQTVARSIRDTDHIYRYGGEEFVLLLPHTGLADALTCARRLVATVGREPLAVASGRLAVTVSAGVASTQEGYLLRKDLLAAADGALYAAKRGGRNRAMARHTVA